MAKKNNLPLHEQNREDKVYLETVITSSYNGCTTSYRFLGYADEYDPPANEAHLAIVENERVSTCRLIASCEEAARFHYSSFPSRYEASHPEKCFRIETRTNIYGREYSVKSYMYSTDPAPTDRETISELTRFDKFGFYRSLDELDNALRGMHILMRHCGVDPLSPTHGPGIYKGTKVPHFSYSYDTLAEMRETIIRNRWHFRF